MRSPLPLLVAVLLVATACGTSEAAGSTTDASSTTETTTTSTVAPSTSTSATSASTTTAPASTTTTGSETQESLLYDTYQATEVFHEGLEVDVFAPDEIGDLPVVVTVHGGGWYAGDRASMGLLADGLADRGAVVFNISYSTGVRGGMFPGAVDDVACGVAHARATADRYTTTPESVYLVGYSAGAHMGSLVALDPKAFGLTCANPVPQVEGFVGLAGLYNVELLEFILQPWFGVSSEVDPDIWNLGNPLTYVDRAPAIPYLLIHGNVDELAPVAFSEQFYEALTEAGADARLEIIRDAGHGEVNHPRVVGDLIAALLAGQ